MLIIGISLFYTFDNDGNDFIFGILLCLGVMSSSKIADMAVGGYCLVVASICAISQVNLKSRSAQVIVCSWQLVLSF